MASDDLTAHLRELAEDYSMSIDAEVSDCCNAAADRIDADARRIEACDAEMDRLNSALVDALAERDAALAEVHTLSEAANRVNRAWLRGDLDGPDGEGPAALLALHRAADTEEAKSDGD